VRRGLLVAGLIAALLGGPMPALAQTAAAPAPAKLLPAQSEIVFSNRQMGAPVEGRFRKFDAQVAFDPRHPETGRIALTVDLASVSLGSTEVEAEVAKAEWFSTGAFPQAGFQSNAIKALGGGRFELSGKFTLKGVQCDLVVPVLLTQAGGISTASGSFVIKRLDFKIGAGDWSDTSLVANEVSLRFKLLLSGVPLL
jgi:polyisoprenoid-binding protein YceI